MIAIENFSISYATFLPVSCVIDAGCAIKIDGKNGIGKTAFLKTLAGINDCYSGSIKIDGCEIGHRNKKEQSILSLFDKNEVRPNERAIKHISEISKLYSSHDLSEAAIKFFKLDTFRDTKMNKLSSGTARKVGLSKFLTCPSSIWLIDEADSYLDKISLELLKGLFENAVAQGKIVFFSAHGSFFDEIISIKITLKNE